jgi:hypothetical protein
MASTVSAGPNSYSPDYNMRGGLRAAKGAPVVGQNRTFVASERQSACAAQFSTQRKHFE